MLLLLLCLCCCWCFHRSVITHQNSKSFFNVQTQEKSTLMALFHFRFGRSIFKVTKNVSLSLMDFTINSESVLIKKSSKIRNFLPKKLEYQSTYQLQNQYVNYLLKVSKKALFQAHTHIIIFFQNTSKKIYTFHQYSASNNTTKYDQFITFLFQKSQKTATI